MLFLPDSANIETSKDMALTCNHLPTTGAKQEFCISSQSSSDGGREGMKFYEESHSFLAFCYLG
jgi:hypothetical protein